MTSAVPAQASATGSRAGGRVPASARAPSLRRLGQLPALLVMLAAGALWCTGTLAYDEAACQVQCQAACRPDDPHGSTGCQVCLNGCFLNSRGNGARSGGPSRPPPPSAQWGFIVFDTGTGRWGASAGRRVGIEARGEARERCRKAGGARCDWVISAPAGCIAIVEGEKARGRTAHRKSGDTAAALEHATKIALAECRKQGGQGCKRVAQVCSFDAAAR